ncbi:RNA 2'-phosphotransferase, Tpt1 / KptA family [Thorsellia anophelis DSM 18579]|uniref:RNA 2'-phosphotransferase, Tpt1 / KptA family n=1 Tax=Thorsellia anophelis DSM 18579 TaxID=1123402 RepID=A0A1I0G4U7_9GAMM|nr:RNA 2'-phosphotransferase, Tpt1 / KptA family [Thorsellia anophelis DSM 18579]
MSQSLDKVSKFLSFVLRHQPEAIGINLDSEGWVEIENLIYQAGINGTKLDLGLIEQVVSTSDKKRLTLSECKRKI